MITRFIFPRLEIPPEGLPQALREAEEIAETILETFEALRFDNIHTYLVKEMFINDNYVIQATAWSQTGRLSVEIPYDSDPIHIDNMITHIYKFF